MLKPFELLEGVLEEIERGLKSDINAAILAKKFLMSSIHLQRLFKFAFGQTIGSYIRSRKLAASVEDLLNTDMKVLSVAMDYGLGYEQSYIRAFKREFGLTPGELRKSGQIVKITPPLQLFDSNRLEDGLLFGPEIVMIPKFHVAGRRHKMPGRGVLNLAATVVKQFFYEDRIKIPNAVNPDVLIVLCRDAGENANYTWFMPSIQVKSLDDVPKGFDYDTFPSSLCAKFRYIKPDDSEMNLVAADGMYSAITDFMDNEQQKYFLERKRITIDRIDSSADNNLFSHREWFAPVIEKSKIDIPHKQEGIVKTYKQKMPALRFIGKRYSAPFDDSFFVKMGNNFFTSLWNNMFDTLEKQSSKYPKSIYEGSDSYVILIRAVDDELEYCLGMFMPEGTEVPKGYEKIDFQESELGVCGVYGKKNSIINYYADCVKKLEQEGMRRRGEDDWFFLRLNWREFFMEDKYGKRILEYCYFLD